MRGRSSLKVRIARAHIPIALDPQHCAAFLPRRPVLLETPALPQGPHGDPQDAEGREHSKAVQENHVSILLAAPIRAKGLPIAQ